MATNLAAVSERLFWNFLRPAPDIHSSVALIKELPGCLVI